MTSLSERFAKNLKSAREQLDWSQLKLAQAIGIDVTTVSRLERNMAGATLERAAELAVALGVSLASLLEASEVKHITKEPKSSPAVSSARTMGIFKARREALGFSQTSVAARSGMQRGYISKLERGETRLYLSTLDSLARGLGVMPTELL